MSLTGKRRFKPEEEMEIDMVPVMNMFLVIIPFLLMSASFLQLKSIHTSTPVQAESIQTKQKTLKKVTAVAEIKTDGIHLSILSDDALASEQQKWDMVFKKTDAYPLDEMAAYLIKIKDAYPGSETLIIIPDETIIYDTIISVMDTARYTQAKAPLFPGVVLSGKVG